MFTKWININICHFLIHLIKMTSYNIYPILPSAPSIRAQWPQPDAPPLQSRAPPGSQAAYHLNVVQANRCGLKTREQMFKKKYEQYTKILNGLTWLNACSSGISIATGISSVETFVTFIRIPVSAALGAASITGAIASGIISALMKRYQQKLKKVTLLIDIITPALVVFERIVSGSLKDGVINEEEFNMLQTLYLETLNQLTGVDCRMEAEHRSLVEKSLMEKINELKKKQEQKLNCLLTVLLTRPA